MQVGRSTSSRISVAYAVLSVALTAARPRASSGHSHPLPTGLRFSSAALLDRVRAVDRDGRIHGRAPTTRSFLSRTWCVLRSVHWSAAVAAAAALAATPAEHRSAAPCQGLELGPWQVLLGFVIALWALKPKRQWTDCIGKVDMPECCRQFRYPLMHAGAPLAETSQCTPACFVFGRTRVEGKLVELKDGPTFYKSAPPPRRKPASPHTQP